ncbi:HD family phosphohydrolase [Fusibacter sp. JL216-2]|uniref:HD family phosphohydrolase n=1 Tax=Fusibacter sp. JL216-2 TaxID=3071453 RepID=UPI003D34AC94
MELRKSLKKMYFFSKIFKSSRLRMFGLGLFVWLTLFFSFSATMGSGKYAYTLGDTAREDIAITKDLIDDEATMRLRDKAENDVDPVLYIDPTVQVDSKKEIRDFFEKLYSVRSDFAGDRDVLIQVYTGMESDNEEKLTDEELTTLVLMDQRKLEDVETIVNDLVLQTMSMGISGNEIIQKKTDAELYLNSLEFDEDIKQIMGKIVGYNIRPNRFIDVEATERIVSDQRAEIESVKIEAGTIIVRQGSTITKEHLRILEMADLLFSNTLSDQLAVFGVLGFTLVVAIAMFSYLRIFQADILDDMKKTVLIISVFLLIFLTSRVVSLMSIYMVPVTLFPIVIGLAVSPAIGIVLSGLLAILVSVWNGAAIQSLTIMMLGSVIAGVTMSRAHHRSNILMAGVYIAAINALAIFGLGMLGGEELVETAVHALNGAFGGIIAAVLSLGLLPIVETMFHVLTPMKLLELSNPNNPVLKRLLIEAPGTYHHSILVGNLAEAAAHDIDANSLLARVGAFYHDIGKLERPYYFKENQITAENPHDRLIPAVSASIIKRHSTYGAELGETHNLPKEIVDIIIQHHGTTSIKYFYHKACEDSDDPDNINPLDFAYDGPIPSSREAAIVMLADSVEAAVRSLQEPTHDHIENMVDKIIDGKMEEGQLEASDLTFKDLRTIKNAFMVVLKGIFHERIEYPDLSEFDVRR